MFKRTLSKLIAEVNRTFPVLLLTGPRQIGKTTLLEMCQESERAYVTLDDFDQRELARTDPRLFLQSHPHPLIIDEIQYAPELFSAIKIIVDREKKPGLFWITGSQKFSLSKGISESLAGRVAIVDMLGLSQAELQGRPETSPFLPTGSWIECRRSQIEKVDLLEDVYEGIWRGSFPALWQAPSLASNKVEQSTNIQCEDRLKRPKQESLVNRDLFYKSYIQTYIQRDVREIVNITDDLAFSRFLAVVAARTGQLINFSDIGRDVDIDHKTVKSWLSVLERSGLVYLLQPYFNNLTKRVVKSPKIYFLDTGLFSYLTGWPTAQSLEIGAISGAILESYIFAEILKSYWHSGQMARFYFYRDTDQQEIDLLIETGEALYPIEFKKTARPSKTASRHFKVLEKFGKTVGPGAVLCFVEEPVAVSREVTAIPIGYL